jgi:hypothetical protein
MFRRGPKVSIRTGSILTIVRVNLSQANQLARASVGESGRCGADPARLGGFILTTTPGKVSMERDDYQSLFGALFDVG